MYILFSFYLNNTQSITKKEFLNRMHSIYQIQAQSSQILTNYLNYSWIVFSHNLTAQEGILQHPENITNIGTMLSLRAEHMLEEVCGPLGFGFVGVG